MQSVSVTPMSTPTQITSVESSSSEAYVGDASGATASTSILSSSITQGPDASVVSSSASPTSAESTTSPDASTAELTVSTTSAQSTASTSASDATEAPASTTTGAGARVEKGWYVVVGVSVGVVVATVFMA